MPVVMIQRGSARGHELPHDGQYLKSMDFEAHNGRGEIALTPDLAEAMVFPDLMAAFAFWRSTPKCKPIRDHDGQPNRPLTAANWEFKNT